MILGVGGLGGERLLSSHLHVPQLGSSQPASPRRGLSTHTRGSHRKVPVDDQPNRLKTLNAHLFPPPVGRPSQPHGQPTRSRSPSRCPFREAPRPRRSEGFTVEVPGEGDYTSEGNVALPELIFYVHRHSNLICGSNIKRLKEQRLLRV